MCRKWRKHLCSSSGQIKERACARRQQRPFISRSPAHSDNQQQHLGLKTHFALTVFRENLSVQRCSMKSPHVFSFIYARKCGACVPPSALHPPRDWLKRSLHPANVLVLLADSTLHLISTQNAPVSPASPPLRGTHRSRWSVWTLNVLTRSNMYILN